MTGLVHVYVIIGTQHVVACAYEATTGLTGPHTSITSRDLAPGEEPLGQEQVSQDGRRRWEWLGRVGSLTVPISAKDEDARLAAALANRAAAEDRAYRMIEAAFPDLVQLPGATRFMGDVEGTSAVIAESVLASPTRHLWLPVTLVTK